MHNLRLITAFAFHTVAAVALFALIGGAAALLNLYIRVLETVGMSPLIIGAIHLTEYFLFGVDLLCFLVYVAREAWLLLWEILSYAPHAEQPLPSAPALLAGPDDAVHPGDLG